MSLEILGWYVIHAIDLPFRLLLHHTHCLKKPDSYYLEAPPLPPEDLEPPPEKPVWLAVIDCA